MTPFGGGTLATTWTQFQLSCPPAAPPIHPPHCRANSCWYTGSRQWSKPSSHSLLVGEQLSNVQFGRLSTSTTPNYGSTTSATSGTLHELATGHVETRSHFDQLGHQAVTLGWLTCMLYPSFLQSGFRSSQDIYSPTTPTNYHPHSTHLTASGKHMWALHQQRQWP